MNSLGIEPKSSCSSGRRAHQLRQESIEAARVGFEPTIIRLTAGRSATEPPRNVGIRMRGSLSRALASRIPTSERGLGQRRRSDGIIQTLIVRDHRAQLLIPVQGPEGALVNQGLPDLGSNQGLPGQSRPSVPLDHLANRTSRRRALPPLEIGGGMAGSKGLEPSRERVRAAFSASRVPSPCRADTRPQGAIGWRTWTRTRVLWVKARCPYRWTIRHLYGLFVKQLRLIDTFDFMRLKACLVIDWQGSPVVRQSLSGQAAKFPSRGVRRSNRAMRVAPTVGLRRAVLSEQAVGSERR